MHIERILVLDDEPIIASLVTDILKPLGYVVQVVGSLQEAREALKAGTYDLILSDVRLPDGNGIELLKQLQAETDPPIHMVMSGYGTIESATEAMRLGAADYLVKPFSADQIVVAIQRVEKWRRIATENAYLRDQAAGTRASLGLVGESPAMREVQNLIAQIGPTNATVLISGESGTGKELVARALFEASPRSKRPFIRLNCAAIPENLIESELFGHEKGAFTDAHAKRLGRFEMADTGTLLLDEISELPMLMQVRLLRVLQEREFERVGGNRTISVDVRILAATNRNLEQEVQQGKFREDLFYRLNVVPIRVPPLRERADDHSLLLDHFLKYFSGHHGKPTPEILPEARAMLCHAAWPGNVRELQNAVERAVILAAPRRPLMASDFGLADSLRKSEGTTSQEMKDLSLERMEKRLIQQAILQTQGNRTQAARLLGISVRTLRYKLKEE